MRNLIIIIIALTAFQCSPRMAPDAAWAYRNWVLVEMKGVPVQQSGGRRDAHIVFDVSQKRFSGNGGCNQINGSYSVDKNEIRFTDIIATKMACPDIEFENTFLSALHDVDRYEVNGDDLLLKKRREILLVLRPR